MIQSVLSVVVALLVVFMTAFYSEKQQAPIAPVIIVVSSTTTEFSLPFEPATTTAETVPPTDDSETELVATSSGPTLEDIFSELLETSVQKNSPEPLTLPNIFSKPKTYTPVKPPSEPVTVYKPNLETPSKAPKQSEDPDITSATGSFIKSVIVNIVCIPPSGYGLRGTSGSGVIIDSSGYIITVAHVGQYFLWKDFPTDGAGSCVVRTGNPARDKYYAELVYIPEQWVKDNKSLAFSASMVGDGRRDFAILAITGAVSGGSLPNSYTAAEFVDSSNSVSVGDAANIGGYGAEFLTSTQIRESLSPIFVSGVVERVFSWDTQSVDVMEINGGIAAQQGSSGGGVLNDDNEFMGLITSRSNESTLTLRDLQALTVSHIRRTFQNEKGSSLDSYLAGSKSELVDSFKKTDKPDLIEILETAIP